MRSKFAYCPVCMYRDFVVPATEAEDYICPRHGIRCVYSDKKTILGRER